MALTANSTGIVRKTNGCSEAEQKQKQELTISEHYGLIATTKLLEAAKCKTASQH